MFNLNSLLANSYSGFSQSFNLAHAYCVENGLSVPCPDFGVLFGFGFGLFMIFVWLVAILLIIVPLWKIFQKAGQPGWTAIVPVYNHIIMLRIIKKPEWWVLFMFVPFVNLIVSFIIVYHLAKTFGKGVGYALGMIFLPFIFYPILGFGNAVYTTPITNEH